MEYFDNMIIFENQLIQNLIDQQLDQVYVDYSNLFIHLSKKIQQQQIFQFFLNMCPYHDLPISFLHMGK
ncbi:unnamed protein product [Paramecium primaurelia]|uniref:Uncharacterized protein n=1 Tax=Paramecium primaurelia TaxID=5886 RepID=A0A8S1QR40_PARPR|nr:unnamed protein product [Paramecium primaurelia]